MRRHKTRSGLAGMAGRMKPYADRAKRKAGPVVEDTWEQVEQAREKVTPVVENARDKATEAVSTAMTASEPYRKEAQKRGSAALLALRGELEPAPPKKRHWVRRILLIGGLGGAAVAAYRVLRNGTGAGWQPTPATMPPSRTDSSEPSESEPASTTESKAESKAESKPESKPESKADSGSSSSVRPVADAAKEPKDTDSDGDQPGKHTKAKAPKEPAAAGAKKTTTNRSTTSSSGSSGSSGSSVSSGSNTKPTPRKSSS